MPPQEHKDFYREGDGGMDTAAQNDRSETASQQWQDISVLKRPDAGRVTAEHTVADLFGNVQIFEQPARQALEPPPPISDTLNGAPYNSQVTLNVQITNVAEVPEPVQSLDDLQALAGGIAQGLQEVAWDRRHSKPLEEVFPPRTL